MALGNSTDQGNAVQLCIHQPLQHASWLRQVSDGTGKLHHLQMEHIPEGLPQLLLVYHFQPAEHPKVSVPAHA